MLGKQKNSFESLYWAFHSIVVVWNLSWCSCRVPSWLQEAEEGKQGALIVVKLMSSSGHCVGVLQLYLTYLPQQLFLWSTEKSKFGEVNNCGGRKEWQWSGFSQSLLYQLLQFSYGQCLFLPLFITVILSSLRLPLTEDLWLSLVR